MPEVSDILYGPELPKEGYRITIEAHCGDKIILEAKEGPHPKSKGVVERIAYGAVKLHAQGCWRCGEVIDRRGSCIEVEDAGMGRAWVGTAFYVEPRKKLVPPTPDLFSDQNLERAGYARSEGGELVDTSTGEVLGTLVKGGAA
ncbi:MAG TPA: hypothetical protein VGN26_04730 [Armatimonadota bacterium]|jgi:hypothetical protein